LKLKRGINFGDVRKVYLTLEHIDPDVVLCHLGVVFHVLPFAFFNPKTQFFHTIHNDAAVDANGRLGTIIRRWMYRREIFKAITISEESRESFKRFYRLSNSHLILNGRSTPVKTSRFNEVKTILEEAKIHSDDLVFLHVGRQDTVTKNQRMLVEVFNRLIAEGQHAILALIGNDYDLPEGVILKQMATQGIYFFGAQQNVADWYLNSDAFCLSSRAEGMPISLIEALGCGCTPVCTPVGGIKNIITDGVNGFLSEGTDGESYYRAVKKYIENKDSISKESLKAFFETNYTIEKCGDEYIKAFLQ
jgi:glycosyltransferase involved in cell wall biosynthesis